LEQFDMGKNMLSLKNPLHYVLIGVLFLVLMASPFVMMSNDFTITPSNPVVGNSVTIKGTATPNSQVTVQVLYEQSLPVRNGAYQLALKGIVVPTASNSFTIKTTNVQSMSVGLKQRKWIL
jgi:hypothetical protein